MMKVTVERTHLDQDSQGSSGLELVPDIALEEYPVND
jgi:hypothetical protein